MFEVFGDGTEGERKIIGRTTQFINHYRGIPIAKNCIVITSDANGLHSVSNQWREITPIMDTAMILISPELTDTEKQALQLNYQAAEREDGIQNTGFVYLEKDGRCVLHRDVELTNGRHIFLDAQTRKIVS